MLRAAGAKVCTSSRVSKGASPRVPMQRFTTSSLSIEGSSLLQNEKKPGTIHCGSPGRRLREKRYCLGNYGLLMTPANSARFGVTEKASHASTYQCLYTSS